MTGIRRRRRSSSMGVRRQAAQAGRHREPQRLLLHARSPDRRAARHEQVFRDRELGERAERQRAAGSHSREGSPRRRRAGVVEQRRRDQLAAAGLQPGHRPRLRAHGRELRDVLPHRARSARRDGAGRQGRSRRRRRWQLHRGHRLQDRQDGVAPQIRDGHGDRPRHRRGC